MSRNHRQLHGRSRGPIGLLVWDLYLLPLPLIMGFAMFVYFVNNTSMFVRLQHVAPPVIIAYFLVVHPLLCILRIVSSKRRFVLPCVAIAVSFFLGWFLPKLFIFFAA